MPCVEMPVSNKSSLRRKSLGLTKKLIIENSLISTPVFRKDRIWVHFLTRNNSISMDRSLGNRRTITRYEWLLRCFPNSLPAQKHAGQRSTPSPFVQTGSAHLIRTLCVKSHEQASHSYCTPGSFSAVSHYVRAAFISTSNTYSEFHLVSVVVSSEWPSFAEI